MNLMRALAINSLVIGASACSTDGGETLVVHIQYSNEEQLVGNAINSNFDICWKDQDNRITIVIDDLPPDATIPNSGNPNLPLERTTTYKCSDLLED